MADKTPNYLSKVRLNILLCEKFNENDRSINRIKDVVEANEDGRVSFDLVVLGNIELDIVHEAIVFISYLRDEEKVEKDSRMKLLEFEIPINCGSDEVLYSRNDYCASDDKSYVVLGFCLHNVPSAGKGDYELILYSRPKGSREKFKRIATYGFVLK